MDDPRYEAGMKVRREVLGDEHVDRATANATDFSRPFQEFITRSAWGEAWTRPGLDRKTRSCITLAILTALRAENEIPMHVRAARPQRPHPGGDPRGAASTPRSTPASPPPTAPSRSPRRRSSEQ